VVGSTTGDALPAGVRAVDQPAADSYRFRAFISYSHRDERWAHWLERRLEQYRVPHSIIWSAEPNTIPRRLLPVFLDRDELPASADLGANLRAALAASRALIVICSPAAAESHWVNEEVRYFRSLGREDRVLCLVVDGEPNVGASDPRSECLPAELRSGDQAGGDGREPVAADVRPGAERPSVAFLRLVAGLLGVRFDDLWHRERRRRVRRAIATVVSSALAVVLLSLGWTHGVRNLRINDLTAHGVEETDAGHLLRASVYYAEAYRQGGRAPLLLEKLRESAKALARPVTTLHGHTDRVMQAVFSEDGRRLLTAGWDKVAILWDVATATPLKRLPHEGRVVSVAFSPDGNTIASAGWDRVTRLWNRNGEPVGTLVENHGRINAVTFSRDGEYLVTATDDQVASVWTKSGRLLHTLRGHDDSVKWAAFSPDGRRVVTASFDRTVRVWDRESGRLLRTLEGHTGPVLTVAYRFDGARVATASMDGTAAVWNPETGEKTFDTHLAAGYGDRVNSAFFSRDGKLAITASDDGTARVWDVDKRALMLSLERHKGNVTFADFSPDGRLAVTTGQDRLAVIWEVAAPPEDPDAIVALVDERAPWRIEDGQLISTEVEQPEAPEVVPPPERPDRRRRPIRRPSRSGEPGVHASAFTTSSTWTTFGAPASGRASVTGRRTTSAARVSSEPAQSLEKSRPASEASDAVVELRER